MPTMTDVLTETAAEVEQLVINCLSEFFEEVVLPRYMMTTKDGVQLGATWWAEKLGMTATAVTSRVSRLKQKSTSEALSGVTGPSPAVRENMRKAKALLRNPETAAAVLESLKAEELTDLRNTIANVEFERHHEEMAARTGVSLDRDRSGGLTYGEVLALHPEIRREDPEDEVLEHYNRACSEAQQAAMLMHQHGINVFLLESTVATVDELVQRGHLTREAILDVQTVLLAHKD